MLVHSWVTVYSCNGSHVSQCKTTWKSDSDFITGAHVIFIHNNKWAKIRLYYCTSLWIKCITQIIVMNKKFKSSNNGLESLNHIKTVYSIEAQQSHFTLINRILSLCTYYTYSEQSFHLFMRSYAMSYWKWYPNSTFFDLYIKLSKCN